jgi:hypothetical protein
MEQPDERHEQDEETANGADHHEDERELDTTDAKAKAIEDDPSANPPDDLLRGIKGG